MIYVTSHFSNSASFLLAGTITRILHQKCDGSETNIFRINKMLQTCEQRITGLRNSHGITHPPLKDDTILGPTVAISNVVI